MLRDFVVRLVSEVNTPNSQILELQSRPGENNVIVKEVDERSLILKNVFIQGMGMDETIVNSVPINKLHRIGSFDSHRKFPRPNFIHYADR